MDARLDSLEFNQRQQAGRIRAVEKLAYILDSPWYMRLLWWIDGWPLFSYVDKPKWRPWRRWWRS